MPLLRAKEIAFPLTKAEIRLALCDVRLADEMEKARPLAPGLERIVYWGSGCSRQPRSDDEKGRLRALRGLRHGERRCLPDRFHLGYHRCAQGHDAFSPRHARDLRHVRKIRAARRAATIASSARRRSLLRSALAVSCCFRCASAPPRSCWREPRADDLLPAIANLRATICFTAPTAFRAMLRKLAGFDLSSLRKCVSAGETLPARDLRGVGGGDRHPHHRRARLDGDAAHLHRQRARTTCARARPASRFRATRRG